MVFWGNAGSSLIAFVSMLSIKIFALFLLAVTAFGLTFHYPKRLVQGYGVMFGLGMIMYGLFLVKSGAAGFASMAEVSDLLQFIEGAFFLYFITGLVLTLIVQSNIAIMLITIAMASAGLFGLEEAAMTIFGAQAGTGILTWIFSYHSKGSAREVVITQVAFDLIEGVVDDPGWGFGVAFDDPFVAAAAIEKGVVWCGGAGSVFWAHAARVAS